MYNYPDSTTLPPNAFTKPWQPSTIVSHRTILNSEAVYAHGIIVGILSHEDVCGSSAEARQQILICSKFGIYLSLADTNKNDRDKNYDFVILVNEDEKGYKVGDEVTIKVIITGSKKSIISEKVYESSEKELSQTELKYHLREKFNDKISVCGSPVGNSDENENLRRDLIKFPYVEADKEEFSTILIHTGLNKIVSLSNYDKRVVVNEHDILSAIQLEPFAETYKFILRSSENRTEFIFEGFITKDGAIEITKKEYYPYGCPICLAADTRIDTPNGQMPVKDLKKGMEVWTTNIYGKRSKSFILETAKNPAPIGHQMVHLVLKDGRELFASPAHPTADGRKIGDLSYGHVLDDSKVVSAERVLYQELYTYDILPSGETGTYWANGILIGSTLYNKVHNKN